MLAKKSTHRTELAEAYPQIASDLKTKTQLLADTIINYDPWDLLHRAFWEFMASSLMNHSESQERIHSLRVLEYLQNYYASKKFSKLKQKLTEQAWGDISKLVTDIETTIFHWTLARTADLEINHPETFNSEKEALFAKELFHWVHVRGDRYDIHEIDRLRELLEPHDDIFLEIYSISAKDFVSEIEAIKRSLSFGIPEAFNEMKDFQEECFGNLEHLEKLSLEGDNDLKRRGSAIASKIVGLDLCDLSKITNLPKKLLDDLSWGEGDCPDFWTGDLSGTPLLFSPIKKKPFIKMCDNYYCFNQHQLFDNIYRVMERLIKSHSTKYYEKEWRDNQKKASESAAENIIRKIMPSANIIAPAYYGKVGQRIETDIIVIYDKSLLIFEIKAVASLSISPVESFDLFLKKLDEIIKNSIAQGERLLTNLKETKTLEIYSGPEKSSELLVVLDIEDFEMCLPFGVSVDSFTHLTSKEEVRQVLGITKVDGPPSISISLDDLRVFGDIFLSKPMQFIHFLTQRQKAMRYNVLESHDELDHLGLYLSYNDYIKKCKSDVGSQDVNMMFISDATEVIDSFYTKCLADQSNLGSPPQQALPQILANILDLLEKKNINGRTKLANLFLDCSSSSREQFSKHSESRIVQLKLGKKVSPLIHHGKDKLMIFFNKLGVDLNWQTIEAQAYSFMSNSKCSRLMCLNLFFDDKKRLCDLDCRSIEAGSLSPTFYESAEGMFHYTSSSEPVTKLGRNDKCSCGSGKKYKKCCLN